jgi:PAS domain S-box-containing protein
MTDSPTIPLGEQTTTDHDALSAGVISAVGVLLAGLHVPHIVEDVTHGLGGLALLTGAVLPFLLSVAITIAGVALWRGSFPSGHLRRVRAWFLVGIGTMTVVSGGFIYYELLEGARLSHGQYLFLNFATTGGGVGVLLGWYDARTQCQQAQLRIFRKVVEYTGHCIYLTGPDGTIEYTNPAFQAQTGYDRTEAVGQTPRILKSGEHDDAFYGELWETILSGDVWQNELVNEGSDGTQYWVDQTIAPVTDDDAEIEHFVAINTDITKLKEYQNELERQNERLEEFASVVSHDLRNPLNVAAGRIALAANDCDDEHLSKAKRAIDRMEQLIEDVLALARQGRIIDETEPVSLRSVSRAAWRNVDATHASLRLETDQTIRADESRLQQLLENLFRNAIEHGGADCTVEVGTFDSGFYVEDTGEGFPGEASEQYFESGFSTDRDGTGLGLAIVDRIAEAHGWECAAKQGSGGGARIEVSLAPEDLQPTPVP